MSNRIRRLGVGSPYCVFLQKQSIISMKKHLLLMALALASCLTADAQFRYIFKDTTTPYMPLSSGTPVNGSTIWDEEDFTLPLPFTFKMDSSISLTSLELSLSNSSLLEQVTNKNDMNGF